MFEIWKEYRPTGDPVSSTFTLTNLAKGMTHLEWQFEDSGEVTQKLISDPGFVEKMSEAANEPADIFELDEL